jgi:hypothetical protein
MRGERRRKASRAAMMHASASRNLLDEQILMTEAKS